MVLNKESLENLHSIRDRRIFQIIKGIDRLFDSKFPPENYNLQMFVDRDGNYHLIYKKVEYSLAFMQEDNLEFHLKADFPHERKNFEERINESLVSNKRIGRTKYLSNQGIFTNGFVVDISCRLKKIPENDKEANRLCEQLWGYIIKRTMGTIYKDYSRKS